MLKKALSLIVLLMTMSVLSAVSVGTNPEISINSVSYTDRFGNPIYKPFYNGDRINVSVNVYDLQGWYDLKSLRIYLGDAYVGCTRKITLSDKEAVYYCIFTVSPSLKGSYEGSIVAEDKGGLTAEVSIGNFYFNPDITLTNDEIIFSPENPVMGQVSETDWINVKTETPTDNPYTVVLYGNNLYEDKSNCEVVNVCSKYEKKCEVNTTYVNKTVKNCSIVSYERYGKIYHKTVCNYIKVLVPKNTTYCYYTDNCVLLKQKTVCPKHTILCGNSNALELKNFKYKLEEGDWENLSYSGVDILNGEGSEEFKIKFKVDVPNVCYGNFILDGRNINFAIRK